MWINEVAAMILLSTSNVKLKYFKIILLKVEKSLALL